MKIGIINMSDSRYLDPIYSRFCREIIRSRSEYKFYFLTLIEDYYYKKYHKVFNIDYPNHNVEFSLNELLDKYPEAKDHYYKNKRILNDTKKIIDEINNLADDLDAVICFGLSSKTGVAFYSREHNGKYVDRDKLNYNSFFANYFLINNSDIPLIAIEKNANKINTNYEYLSRVPDDIFVINNKDKKKSVIFDTYDYQLPDGRMLDNTKKEVSINELNDCSKLDMYNEIFNAISYYVDNECKGNSFEPFRKKIKVKYYEGPKASGKTTLINNDIKENNYSDDEYLILHSNVEAPNDYKYFSDQLDFNFDRKHSKFDHNTYDSVNNIDWNKIKVVYIDRGILSEYVYGQMVENIIAGFQESEVKPFGSIDIKYLKHCNLLVNDMILLFNKNDITLNIKYFNNNKTEKEALESAINERKASRLTQYEQDLLHPSNLAFQAMIRLLRCNINNKLNAIEYK